MKCNKVHFVEQPRESWQDLGKILEHQYLKNA